MASPTVEPFRLRLTKGLCDLFTQITKDNGFYTDAGKAVYRGRLTFGANEPLPAIALLEPPLQPDPLVQPLGSVVHKQQLDIYVQGFAVDDRNNPTDPAQLLLADIKKVIALEWKRVQNVNFQQPGANLFGVPRRRIQTIDADGGLVRPSDDISSKAYCYLLLRFTLAEDWLNPDE